MATNNEAEYKALIKGLHRCVEYCKGEVEHLTDSKLVAKQASGEWMVRAPNLKSMIEEISREKRLFERVIHIHVPRTHPKVQRIDGIINSKMNTSAWSFRRNIHFLGYRAVPDCTPREPD